MAVMHTTMMSANMTAYSTAVGPSSALRKLTADLVMRDNMVGQSFRESRQKVRQVRLAAAEALASPLEWRRPSGLTPFGGLATPEGPMALRPTLTDGLPLSRHSVQGMVRFCCKHGM